jgi:hypothetical protein
MALTSRVGEIAERQERPPQLTVGDHDLQRKTGVVALLGSVALLRAVDEDLERLGQLLAVQRGEELTGAEKQSAGSSE